MFLQVASAGRRVGLSPDGIRHAVRSGRLRVADKTDRGALLFDEQEVERFGREREARLAQRRQGTGEAA
jgi:hypothetical protein